MALVHSTDFKETMFHCLPSSAALSLCPVSICWVSPTYGGKYIIYVILTFRVCGLMCLLMCCLALLVVLGESRQQKFSPFLWSDWVFPIFPFNIGCDCRKHKSTFEWLKARSQTSLSPHWSRETKGLWHRPSRRQSPASLLPEAPQLPLDAEERL